MIRKPNGFVDSKPRGAPVTEPRKVLREGPTRRGAWRSAPRSALRSRGSPLISCRLPSRALAKPRPESTRAHQHFSRRLGFEGVHA